MYGNTPYVGRPDEPEGTVEVSPATRRALQEGVSRVAAKTRRYLPDEYLVGSRVGETPDGPRVTISVQPPIGNPVSAGFSPDVDAHPDEPIPAEDEVEVARGLAASAALQVKQAMGDDVPPMAR